jgi:hypothetical protein
LAGAIHLEGLDHLAAGLGVAAKLVSRHRYLCDLRDASGLARSTIRLALAAGQSLCVDEEGAEQGGAAVPRAARLLSAVFHSLELLPSADDAFEPLQTARCLRGAAVALLPLPVEPATVEALGNQAGGAGGPACSKL